MQPSPTTRSSSRIEAIDVARGVALLAMAIYHFCWDLEFFGYVEPGTAGQGGLKLFARCIASSFLFLVGVSLFLAHHKAIRWTPFLRRLAMVAGAALAISAATYIATPERFIFFGILHHIAAASLLGLAFLRLPAIVTLAAAVLIVTAPHFLRSPVFDNPIFWWVGLSSIDPPSNDYVPLFPWFGAVLAGIAAAKLASAAGLLQWLGERRPGSWSKPFRLAGRHSLAVYLLHQPVLIGLIWLYAQVYPASPAMDRAAILNGCEEQCRATHDIAFCARYCICVLDRLEADGMLEQALVAEPDAGAQAAIEETARQCTAAAANQEGVQ